MAVKWHEVMLIECILKIIWISIVGSGTWQVQSCLLLLLTAVCPESKTRFVLVYFT